MTPNQLRSAAQKIRERYRPPVGSIPPGEYVSHEAMHALARALDEVAADEERFPGTPAVPGERRASILGPYRGEA